MHVRHSLVSTLQHPMASPVDIFSVGRDTGKGYENRDEIGRRACMEAEVTLHQQREHIPGNQVLDETAL